MRRKMLVVLVKCALFVKNEFEMSVFGRKLVIMLFCYFCVWIHDLLINRYSIWCFVNNIELLWTPHDFASHQQSLAPPAYHLPEFRFTLEGAMSSRKNRPDNLILKLGISQKLFKEVSWISNYKYYTLHLLRAPAYARKWSLRCRVLNRRYMRRCCNRNE